MSAETWRSLGFAVRTCLLACALGALAPVAAHAQELTVEALLARFARIERMSCSYREEKRIALLSSPIVTSGTIHYARPDRMARRVTAPSEQVLLLEGSTLRMGDRRSVETIDLASQPVVRSFVDGIVLLLRGDRAGLERTYRVSLQSTGQAWTLVLRPRVSPLDRFLSEIRFEGDEGGLRRMSMDEVSGDTTTTVFSDVQFDRTWTPAEQARIFSMPR